MIVPEPILGEEEHAELLARIAANRADPHRRMVPLSRSERRKIAEREGDQDETKTETG